MGHYHQCQNDLLDVFNIGGILHKTGHDIEIYKCSWLSCTCMERANDAQKKIMIDNYGKKGERVKSEEIGLIFYNRFYYFRSRKY